MWKMRVLNLEVRQLEKQGLGFRGLGFRDSGLGLDVKGPTGYVRGYWAASRADTNISLTKSPKPLNQKP